MNATFILFIVSSIFLFKLNEAIENKPGKAAVWTYDNSPLNRQDYKTTTVEIPSFIDILQEKSKNSNVIALLKSSDGRSTFSHSSIIDSVRNSPDSMIMTDLYKKPDFIDVSAHESISKSLFMKKAQEISLDEFHHWLREDKVSTSNVRESFIISLSGHESENEKLQEISLMGKIDKKITFIAIQEPSVNMVPPPKNGQYKRLLTAFTTSTTSSDVIDGIYYKPEGSEYSIYYADTYLYITPDIFTGLMTGLFMTFVIFTGLSALGGIQTPSAFATKIPPIGNEA